MISVPDFFVGGVCRFEFPLWKPSDWLTAVDADSTPTIVVVKNGDNTLENASVTHTGVTGIYKVSYTPGSYAAGDFYAFRVTVTITDPDVNGGDPKQYTMVYGCRVKEVMLTAQQVWEYVVTGSTSAMTAVATLLARITALLSTKAEDDTRQEAVLEVIATRASEANATANKEEVLEAINEIESGESGPGDPSGDAGSGSETVILTIKDNEGNPIYGCQCWITTDEAGNNQVAGILYTNKQGKVTFRLDPDTYYLWRARETYALLNPQEFTIA